MTDNDDRIKLEASWKEALREEFDKPYMKQLGEFLRQEKAAGKAIFPPGPLIFNALNTTPLENVKVVIIGQDPYHGPGQAHGLCFSRVIEVVNERCERLVFLLWGSHAQSKQKLIDPQRHLILKSAHPSPLSAYRGFLGNGHFSRTNKFLEQNGKTPIDWSLPDL